MKHNTKFKLALVAAVLVFVACVCLTGCVKVGKNYRINTENDPVTAIEIYFLKDGAPRLGNDLEPVAVVPAERFDEFVDAFNSLSDFRKQLILLPVAFDPNFHYAGYVVKITHESGASEEIDNNGIQNTFDAGGETVATSHCELDNARWEEFLGAFLDTNTP